MLPIILNPCLPPCCRAAYFRRLGARLRRDLFSAAHSFDRDGLYLYKRPVISGEWWEGAPANTACRLLPLSLPLYSSSPGH